MTTVADARGRTARFEWAVVLRQPDQQPKDAVVAWCGAALLLSAFGIAYGLVVLFPCLHQDLQIPYWHLAACFSCSGMVYYLTGLIAWRLSDRYGARPVVCLGHLILAAGLALASFAQTGTEFELCYVVSIGLGVGLTYVPVTGAVQVLCRRSGTRAAGISSAGIGLGALVAPPVINYVMTASGWRAALWGCALFALTAMFASFPFSKSKQARGARCRIFLGLNFRVLYAAQALAALVVYVPFAHIMTWVSVQEQLELSWGVFLVSIVGFGSVIGRVALGLIGSTISEVLIGALCSALIAVSLAGLDLTIEPWIFAALLFVFGVAYGGFNALLGPLGVKVCGREATGQIVGALATSRAVGILVGPWAVGLGYTWLGSYTWPFFACSLLTVCSSGLMLVLHNRLRQGDAELALAAPSEALQPT